jgi:predicted DNA-binding transcriptional regulator AlpA
MVSASQAPTTAMYITLSEVIDNPQRVGEIPEREIPPLMVQLAALQSALAARLLQSAAGTDPADRLLEVDEAAHKLGVSKSWLYRRSARLPFIVHMGRKLMFSEQGIEKYIRQRSGK